MKLKSLLSLLLLLLTLTLLFTACEEEPTPPPAPCEAHTWEGWKTKTAPTCVDGVKTRSCSICGEVEEAPLPATGIHQYALGVCGDCGKHQPTEGLAFTAIKNGEAYAVSGVGTALGATKIVVPDTYEGKPVTEVAEFAFFNKSSLISIILPDTIEKIGDSAFHGCSALTSFTVPKSLKEVEESAFYATVKLGAVYVDSIDTWLGITFDYDTAESCPLVYGATLLVSGEPLVDLVVPKTVEKISGYAFYGCTTLQSVRFEDGSVCKRIGWGAFQNCTSLCALSLPEGFETFNTHAFKGCTSLSTLTLPSTVNTFGADVFRGCTGLRTLVFLPKTIFVPNGVFRDCTALQAVYFGGTEAEWAGVEIYPYNNTALESATRYYFSEQKPTENHGSFWHYKNGTPTVWSEND